MENNTNEAINITEEQADIILKDAFATLEANYGSKVTEDMKMIIPAIEKREIDLHTLIISPDQWTKCDIIEGRDGYAVLANSIIDMDIDLSLNTDTNQVEITTPMTLYTKSDYRFNVIFYNNPEYYISGNNSILIFSQTEVTETIILYIVKEYFKSPKWEEIQAVFYNDLMEKEQEIADSINRYFMNMNNTATDEEINTCDDMDDAVEVDD